MSNATAARINVAMLMGLTAVFAAARAIGIMGPAAWRWLLPAGFVLMALTPWLLLDAEQRRKMGLAPSVHPGWFAWAVAGGALAAWLCFAAGYSIFGTGPDNWYVSIGNNYRRTMNTSGFSLLMLHLVFTVPALIFSPLGEELFFRGVLQQALERRLPRSGATAIECGLFAVVHLCHHGLFWSPAGLDWLPLSAALWMVLMFGTAWLFSALRARSASIYPAILAHMVFNLTMNSLIFGFLWPLPPAV
jgi:membrane protease YdiL (CAAX protease family)